MRNRKPALHLACYYCCSPGRPSPPHRCTHYSSWNSCYLRSFQSATTIQTKPNPVPFPWTLTSSDLLIPISPVYHSDSLYKYWSNSPCVQGRWRKSTLPVPHQKKQNCTIIASLLSLKTPAHLQCSRSNPNIISSMNLQQLFPARQSSVWLPLPTDDLSLQSIVRVPSALSFPIWSIDQAECRMQLYSGANANRKEKKTEYCFRFKYQIHLLKLPPQQLTSIFSLRLGKWTYSHSVSTTFHS